MNPIYANTPLFQSPALNHRLGKTVYFKMDCHQPTRSFKLRGMSHLVSHLKASGITQFVASSGGNAGYSLAYACRHLGVQAHVIVPETTHARMRNMIAEEGAKVEVHGASWQEAHAYAMRLADDRGAYYVSPFDDPLLWEGHATMIDECAQEIAAPDAVVAAVGGGGLLCGIMEGMERNRWLQTEFVAAETKGAASYLRAVEAGKVVSLDAIDTVATSLGAKKVAESALEWSRKRKVVTHICTDAEALTAAKKLADTFNVLVEPACGAALSAVFLPSPLIQRASTVLVIVCGGAGIDTDIFWRQLKDFGLI